MVKVPTNTGGDGLSARFRMPYIGPFTVVHRPNSNNVVISGARHRMKAFINVSRLKAVPLITDVAEETELDASRGHTAEPEEYMEGAAELFADTATMQPELRRSTRERRAPDRFAPSWTIVEEVKGSESEENRLPIEQLDVDNHGRLRQANGWKTSMRACGWKAKARFSM